MSKFFFSLLAAVCLLSVSLSPVLAQSAQPPAGPTYIVQPGDSLSGIAARFNVSLNDLMSANAISDANTLSAGASLVIPGLDGVTGLLVSNTVSYGETLNDLSRRYQVDISTLQKINHLSSPAELYVGVNVIVPQSPEAQPLARRFSLLPGETLLEQAALQNQNPYTLETLNDLPGVWAALPGETYYLPGSASLGQENANGLPPAFRRVVIESLPLTQGRTAKITVTAPSGSQVSGLLVDKPLHFAAVEEGVFLALQGVHAMLEPGPYPLRLEVTLPDGGQQSFEQMIVVQSGYYPDDPILLVEPSTIDPTTSDSEFAQIAALTAPFTPTRAWQGLFLNPSYFPDCFTSRYGNRRVYLGQGTEQKYYSFHSGLDFCGGEGLPITAPAAGTVVFAGPLTIRGNATIIDHGWGVYSGIWHQSKIEVQVGQTVQAGDVIGYVGGTGRVTGAHLHWEVWVNGVQVNPFDWLETAYP